MKNQPNSQNLRCARVYPSERSKKPISILKTLALRLTSAQAAELASALRSEMGNGSTVMVVAFRKPEKDGHRLSVRSEEKAPPRPRRNRWERLDEEIV